VLKVVNTNMERALRHISVERGHDPRQFALLPFGGAGGLHAVELASSLRIPTVILPTSPGALSAIGVLVADVVKDQSRTVMLSCDSRSVKSLPQIFNKMERDARSILRGEGFEISKQRHERSLGMRYRGQSFELEIKYSSESLAERFHEAHRERYGYAQESSEVEIVSARLRSLGLVKPVRDQKLTKGQTKTAEPHYTTTTYLSGKRLQVGVYRREELKPRAKLRTPCIVIEYSATTLIPAAATAVLDEGGNLIISSKQ
jgi:N-methylhydantoinase A